MNQNILFDLIIILKKKKRINKLTKYQVVLYIENMYHRLQTEQPKMSRFKNKSKSAYFGLDFQESGTSVLYGEVKKNVCVLNIQNPKREFRIYISNK